MIAARALLAGALASLVAVTVIGVVLLLLLFYVLDDYRTRSMEITAFVAVFAGSLLGGAVGSRQARAAGACWPWRVVLLGSLGPVIFAAVSLVVFPPVDANVIPSVVLTVFGGVVGAVAGSEWTRAAAG